MTKGEFVRAKGYRNNDYIILDNKTALNMLPEATNNKLWIKAGSGRNHFFRKKFEEKKEFLLKRKKKYR